MYELLFIVPQINCGGEVSDHGSFVDRYILLFIELETWEVNEILALQVHKG